MKKYEFTAIIKKASRGGSYIEFPYSVENEFGVGRVKVLVYFDGVVEYRGSLVNMGGEYHIIGLLKDIKTKIAKDFGDEVNVIVEEDKEERIVETHKLLEDRLEEDNVLKTKYNKLSYSKKKELNKTLFNSKKDTTLLKNLENVILKINGDI